ncbi:MAG: prepilin-type N-terminal cleavage/methylation domain-containing protein [Synergistaceae bacterium]|nr:prepilin-type N-terminal cleavage/methylation domain-containing protein [Synergistaceae bacterium]
MRGKRNLKGFSLAEVLLVVVLIGILAGFLTLTFGSVTDSAEAKQIASELDAVKQATLSYVMENQKRNTDPLTPLLGQSENFKNAISQYMERRIVRSVDVRQFTDGGVTAYYVVLFNIPTDAKLAAALDKIVKNGSGYMGVWDNNTGKYLLRLKLR